MTGSPQPSNTGSAKNPCPICGRPKTAWSSKCQRCEGFRQLYLEAVRRNEEDQRFLERLNQKGVTLQQIGDELGVKRQRVHQLKQDAEKRVNFLRQHPAPRRAFEQVPV